MFRPGSGGFRVRSQLNQGRYSRLIKPELAKYHKSFRQPFVDAWQSTPGHWSDIQRSQYTDIFTALPVNLLVKVDRNTKAFGLEARVPFLDHRIIEFGLSLPDELKTARGQGKLFLKRWAEKYLKPGVTFEILEKVAMKMSDNEAAILLQTQRRKLFNQIFEPDRDIA